MDTIRSPMEWATDKLRDAAVHLASSGRSLSGAEEAEDGHTPSIRSIDTGDLRDVLMKGLDDFRAYRTDVIFLCIIYPVAGLVLARFAFDYDMLPLLFPTASGFALLGPLAAVGLYEMSRRREQGSAASWSDAFEVVRSPSFVPILLLGILLLVIFLFWLAAAQLIYMVTLGPEPPASASAFIGDVLTTRAGWLMIVVGMGIGFVFALVVLAISIVSFPLMLDREVGLLRAVAASIRVVAENPRPVAVWGLIVVGGLVLGSLPVFLGLIFVMPILGHATWHLYRKVVTW